ncbi:hypothetical protein MD588_00275 [Photobacterium sp. SDRW27]|uniref:hypothetical protein n=1 Tax=Photobacterium obscurum TaxID=2829490 RepID=UPI002243FD5D|nr:hypothetical protein [Photobacterium obscurum]MCW8327235.1 hypothetical protein [Photobacterium obscurum]
MSKYQFFVQPNTHRQQFTFLNPDSETFLQEKQQLIAQGFEVEDDYIYAATEQEAVEKFKSNYIYALEEYNAANPISAFALSLSKLCIDVFKRKRN